MYIEENICSLAFYLFCLHVPHSLLRTLTFYKLSIHRIYTQSERRAGATMEISRPSNKCATRAKTRRDIAVMCNKVTVRSTDYNRSAIDLVRYAFDC